MNSDHRAICLILCTSVFIQINGLKCTTGDDSNSTYDKIKDELTKLWKALEDDSSKILPSILEQVNITQAEGTDAITKYRAKILGVVGAVVQVVQGYKTVYGSNVTNCQGGETVVTSLGVELQEEFVTNVTRDVYDVTQVLEFYKDALNTSLAMVQVLFLELEVCSTLEQQTACFNDIWEKILRCNGLLEDLAQFGSSSYELMVEFQRNVNSYALEGIGRITAGSKTVLNVFHDCVLETVTESKLV